MTMIVSDAIHIEAPMEVVWAVTKDVERWPEWTPTVTSLRRADDAPFGLGSSVRIKQPGQPESVWTVTDYVPGTGFSWETRRLGWGMVASHQLQGEGGGTRNTLQLRASGIVARLLWPLLRIAVRHALVQENRGLKERCEQEASGTINASAT